MSTSLYPLHTPRTAVGSEEAPEQQAEPVIDSRYKRWNMSILVGFSSGFLLVFCSLTLWLSSAAEGLSSASDSMDGPPKREEKKVYPCELLTI